MKSFTDAATGAFAQYMKELGFGICSQTNDSVAFESTTKKVSLLLSKECYSYEVDGEIRLENCLYEAARFSEIARMLNKPLIMPYFTRDAEKLADAIETATNFVRSELEVVLSGSDEEMGKLLHLAEKFRRTETLHYSLSPLRKQAEEAWNRKDFSEIVEAYTQMDSALNDIERKRLKYAKSKLDSSR